MLGVVLVFKTGVEGAQFFEVLIVRTPRHTMDFTPVEKWGIFFLGILCAIVLADALATVLVESVGIAGWIKFLVNFVLYAVFFFAILYVLEKIFHIRFFGF
jgi:hypothetical protein